MTTSENKQPIKIVVTVSYAMICFLPDGNSGTVISADLSQPAIYRLLRPARRSHAPGDVRRHRGGCRRDPRRFRAARWAVRCGRADNAQARECARTIAGWKPLVLPLRPVRRPKC